MEETTSPQRARPEAARGGELSVLKYLIKEKGCDRMSRAEGGKTVLHAAAINGDIKVIQCLIDECRMDPKSCIDPMLITIILHRNLRIRERLPVTSRSYSRTTVRLV